MKHIEWTYRIAAFLVGLLLAPSAACADLSEPIVGEDVVFEESDGFAAVEAEHFHSQSLTTLRRWYLVSSTGVPDIAPDGDPAHVQEASGGAYVEVLPDTRRTHDDKLISGENFSNEPGKMAVLHYKVHFNNPGRYYVWVRAHSTGSEDNGIHVGLNGEWPANGQRLQWCDGKNSWYWDSKQRTEQVHCGEPHRIFIDIQEPGIHEIQFAMREDGFEFDKFILTRDREFARPADAGPEVRLKSGTLPKPFPVVKASRFPGHWGEPPMIQTMDYRLLPGGYGHGSSTLAAWITKNMEEDAIPLVLPRERDGDGSVNISGELRQWHKVTVTLNGPYANEGDNAPNPFTDRAFNVTFVHESGAPKYVVPGYFAADGDAAETSANSGTQWRAHLSPDKPGKWSYTLSFTAGPLAAFDGGGVALAPYDGKTGVLRVRRSNKRGRDFRAKGRLEYVGQHYLRFAGSGEYFLKAGADAPETLLAYEDFDGTSARKPKVPLKSWAPHLQDWSSGDPSWKDGKGRGLIGALNYLAIKGVNSFSFLPYNAGGDGDNIWPFVQREDKLHYDVSKLAQWGIVFEHATDKGLYLHFKMQENEMDDDRLGHEAKPGTVPESLDGGALGPERKLYCRELIARFAHNLALNWNIGEENTQSTDEIRAMAEYIHDTDPYHHPIVIHTFPDQQDKVYPPLLGMQSRLTGASLQNQWDATHRRTLQWVRESAAAGKPWVVANDEQGPASTGAPPDPGYQGYANTDAEGKAVQTTDSIRKATLWGNLMAGGAGVEYYFGYQLPQNDLLCEDWRSRDGSWDDCRIAIEFFADHHVPFWEMQNANSLIGNDQNDNSRYCFAKPGELYLIYLPTGGPADLDLSGTSGRFSVRWFNPRSGGPLAKGSLTRVRGGGVVGVGTAPSEPDADWLVVVRR